MLLGVFIGIGIAIYFGGSVVFILTIGALAQSGVAFALSKNPFCIATGISVLMAAISTWFVAPLLLEGVGPNSLFSQSLFNWIMSIIAAISIISTTAIGVLGSTTNEKTYERTAKPLR